MNKTRGNFFVYQSLCSNFDPSYAVARHILIVKEITFYDDFLPLQHLNEGARIQSQLQSSLILLSKTKEKYEKAFGASERALDTYHKADADLNLSRAEVEKQRMNSTIKSQQYDDCKNEYANQLQKTNELQSKYYNQMLPSVFSSLQDLDEKRIKCIKVRICRDPNLS